MKKFKLDTNKLKCFSLSHEYSNLLHRIPLHEYLEKIVLEGNDEVNLTPGNDSRLRGHKIRIFLGKDVRPPMIYIHIDDHFAAQYSYFDEKFAERSDIEDDD